MHVAAVAAGILLLALILWDGFETMLLPRRMTRKFYRASWHFWSGTFGRIHTRKRREQALSVYGPLSMLFLLFCWAVSLMVGFALIHWGRQSPMQGARAGAFFEYFYMSGTT